MPDLEQIIKKRLEATLDCKYKRDYIPKGWAHIHINKFAKELAKELKGKQNASWDS